MKNRIFTLICFLCLSGTAIFLSNAKADEVHRKTILTFSAPVELPGVALPAGTYVFKLVDPYTHPDMVQVFSEDEKTLYANLRTIPDYRLERTADTVIEFEESPSGIPPAIKAWFNPNRHYGHEFIYPKPKTTAMELAQGKRQVIPITAKIAPVITEAAEAEPTESAEVNTMNSPPEESQLAQVESPQQSTQTEQPEPSNTGQEQVSNEAAMLPRTASPLPMIGLGGILLLGGGLALRFFSTRSA